MTLIIIFFFCFTNLQIQAFTTSQLEIVKSISNELSRKHIIIVKNLLKETNRHNLVNTVKYFSNFGIYSVCHSVNEMYLALARIFFAHKLFPYKHYPRTIVFINEDDLQEMAQRYFNVGTE